MQALQSQHADLSAVRRAHNRATNLEGNLIKKLCPPVRQAVTYESIQQNCAIDFFRATVRSNVFVTLVVDGDGHMPTFGSLQDTLDTSIIHRRKRQRTDAATDVSSRLESDLGDVGDESPSRVLCFKVAHPRPSNMRVARLAHGVGGRVAKEDIAITVHSLQGPYDESGVIVSTSPVVFGGESVNILSR